MESIQSNSQADLASSRGKVPKQNKRQNQSLRESGKAAFCGMTKTSHQLGAKRLPSAKESRHCHGEQRSCLFQHTVTSNARGHMTGPLAVRLTAAFWDAGFLWTEVGNERSRNQNTDARLSSSDVCSGGGNL